MSINKDEAFDLWAATNIEPPKPEEKGQQAGRADSHNDG